MKIVGKITSFKAHEFTPENLPTGVRSIEPGMLRLCRSIDSTYPVLGALQESSHSISASSVGIVVSQEGRPNSFSRDPIWSEYDIVSVYVEGNLYECFRGSLDILACQDVGGEQD
jgi:hypothetical protein